MLPITHQQSRACLSSCAHIHFSHLYDADSMSRSPPLPARSSRMATDVAKCFAAASRQTLMLPAHYIRQPPHTLSHPDDPHFLLRSEAAEETRSASMAACFRCHAAMMRRIRRQRLMPPPFRQPIAALFYHLQTIAAQFFTSFAAPAGASGDHATYQALLFFAMPLPAIAA